MWPTPAGELDAPGEAARLDAGVEPDGRWIAGALPQQPGATGWPWPASPRNWAGHWETLASAGPEDTVSQWTPDGRALLFSRRDSPTGRRFPMRLALDAGPPACRTSSTSRRLTS